MKATLIKELKGAKHKPNQPEKIFDGDEPKKQSMKGAMKANITGRLAKRNYKAPKGKMGGDAKGNAYLS